MCICGCLSLMSQWPTFMCSSFTKFTDRRFGQRLYCLGTTVRSEKLVKKLLCNDCKSLFAKHVPGLIYFGPWGLAFKVLKEWNSTSSYIGSCKVEVKRVYWIGYQGGSMVTQLWISSQLSHNGFPMDGALVGAGSYKPNRWIYGVIFLSLNGQQPQVTDECRTL